MPGTEWRFLVWTDESINRVACHEKGCRNYAEYGFRYCITHLCGMLDETWKRKPTLERRVKHG